MRITRKLLIAPILAGLMFSCANEDKSEQQKSDVQNEQKELAYSDENTTLQWTAYKTTDKVPVSGTFKTILVENEASAKTVEDIINSTSFKIPVSTVSTGNPPRDMLIHQFFFGVMANTDTITGTFKDAGNGKGVLSIKMNDVEYENGFEYLVDGDSLFVSSSLLMENWNGLQAVEMLNEKCKAVHSGPDGVSKTWAEVDVLVKSLIRK